MRSVKKPTANRAIVYVSVHIIYLFHIILHKKGGKSLSEEFSGY